MPPCMVTAVSVAANSADDLRDGAQVKTTIFQKLTKFFISNPNFETPPTTVRGLKGKTINLRQHDTGNGQLEVD